MQLFATLVTESAGSPPVSYTARAAQSEAEYLRTQIEADRRFAEELRRLFDSKELRLEQVREALKLEMPRRREMDLGFDAKLTSFSASAGLGRGLVRVIVVKTTTGEWITDMVVGFGCAVIFPDGRRPIPAFKAAVRGAGLNPSEERETGFVFEWRDTVRKDEFNRRMQALLDGPVVLDGPPLSESLKNAVRLLDSPLLADDSVFGVTCGSASGKLVGRQAIEDIVAAERWDVVRYLLRGLDPVGRLYAAQALMESGKATPGDLRAISTLRSQGTLIQYCGGCEIVKNTMAALLPKSPDPRSGN